MSQYDKIPAVIIEAVPIKTEGVYENIPRTYAQLTQNGMFIPSENPDTIMMVDISAIYSRRGKNRSEVARTVRFAKDVFFGANGYDLGYDSKINHLWTYSPDISGIIEMHKALGARFTGHRIQNARNPFLNNLVGMTEVMFREKYPNHNPCLNNVAVNSY